MLLTSHTTHHTEHAMCEQHFAIEDACARRQGGWGGEKHNGAVARVRVLQCLAMCCSMLQGVAVTAALTLSQEREHESTRKRTRKRETWNRDVARERWKEKEQERGRGGDGKERKGKGKR